MSNDTPRIPDDLQDRLRKEPPDVHADLEAVWDLLGTAETTASKESDPEAAWAALVRHHPELDAPPSDGANTSPSGRKNVAPSARREERSARQPHQHRRRVAIGLVLAAVMLIGGLWLWRQPVTVTTPAGQHRTATLPDGSTVELNSGTTLAYRRGFQAWPFVDADQRSVRLDGEAFFEVADGPRTFTVETANAEVVVTGTRFNVRAHPEAGSTSETEVAVVEGSVRVLSQNQPEQSVLLSTPGLASRVTGKTAAPTRPQPTSIEHVLAWRQNGFAARAQPLKTVLRNLERRYDTVLHLHASVKRTRDPISLYYPTSTDLETILHDLCTARDLNYRPTSRGFEIFAASDPQ